MHDVNLFIILFFALLFIIIQYYRVRFLTRVPLWGDTFTYLRIAREIALHKKIPSELDFFSRGNGQLDTFSLPPLLMLLLAPFSRLPYKFLIHFSTIVDIIIACVIATAAHLVFHCSISASIVATLIYLLTPKNCTTSLVLTPRPLGLLSLLLFVVSVSVYFQTGRIIYFALSTVSVSMLLLSQRMATQILFIITPFLILFYCFVQPIEAMYIGTSVFIGILITLIVTRGHYSIIIGDHVRRIFLHAKYGDQNTFRKSVGDPRRLVKENPWLLYTLLFLFEPQPLVDPSMWPIISYLIGIVILSIVWIFGNSINHIYFSSPFVALCIVKMFPIGFMEAILLIVLGLLSFTKIMRVYKVTKGRSINGDWLKCFEYIKEKALNGTVMVLPNISCPPIIYFTDLILISAGHGSGAMSFNRLFLQKNLLSQRFLKNFIIKSEVDYLLVDKEKFPIDSILGLNANGLVSAEVIFDNSQLCLLGMSRGTS